MNASDEVLTWSCGHDRLVGILSAPAEGPCELGVVIVVGGPQYRVGSHRQFTLLARELASAGYPVLRFDYRGRGDSEGDARDFENVSDDIASAIDALLAHRPEVRRVALWGLCDGASAALLYARATHDKRLAGLCLLNPWVRSVQGLAKARVKHYYLHRLRQRDFWLKLVHGKVAGRAALDLARNIGRASAAASTQFAGTLSFQQRMLEGCLAFNGSILVMLSGNDITAQEFVQQTRDNPRWAKAMASGRVKKRDIPDADHTFSSTAAHRKLTDCTKSWLGTLGGSVPIRVSEGAGAAKIEACR